MPWFFLFMTIVVRTFHLRLSELLQQSAIDICEYVSGSLGDGSVLIGLGNDPPFGVQGKYKHESDADTRVHGEKMVRGKA
jgi:hypothetical protein